MSSSRRIVQQLVLKDLGFLRWANIGSLVAGLAALGLLAHGSAAGFYAGQVLLVTVLIVLGALAASLTVIDERKEKTLPFIMSLPVSPRQFAVAKILANALIFGSTWVVLVVGTLAVIQVSDHLPNGMTAYAVLILTEIAMSTCLILMVAMITESLPWTIATMIVGNLFINAFFYIVASLPSFAVTAESHTIVWPRDALGLLWVELVAIVLLLATTYLVSSRRKDVL